MHHSPSDDSGIGISDTLYCDWERKEGGEGEGRGRGGGEGEVIE